MSDQQEKKIVELTAELEETQQKLHAANSAFLNLVGKNRDGIVVVNQHGLIVYANPAALVLFNSTVADLLGKHIGVPISGDNTTEINILHGSTECVTVEISVADSMWNEKPAKLASLRDITERKKTEKVLSHLSRHDYLTDLPNRIYFEETLIKTLGKAKRNKRHMALLYLDMDDFKRVNDVLGHHVGDELLVQVSSILKTCVRGDDTIARIGGDEFAIILDEVKTPLNAADVAQKILDELNESVVVHGNELNVNFSIGIAVYPMGDPDMECASLIKNADIAMYAAKKAGRHQYQFFTAALNQEAQYRLSLESRLGLAIPNDEFYLVYQPIMNEKGSAVIGFEVLLRWRNKELGNVPVVDFLPILEENGLVIEVGEWIIKRACTEYLANNLHGTKLAINMSIVQLLEDRVVQNIFKVLKETGMDPNNVILELTESVIMKNPEQTIKKLKLLTDAGIQLAIDDFGTGYSSLAYLKRMPVSILKIDKSFVRDIGIDSNNTIIVKSIVSLAKNLGLQTVAEGVETQPQLDFLMEYNCTMLQGYYFSQPAEFKDLEAALKNLGFHQND